jgi:hypothetical protein
LSDWQLDRLPGDVRQEAENAAQREGLPLHRWLGKLIRETCDEEGIPLARELARAAANQAAGDGRRQSPVMPARPPVEPIRIPAQSRAAEPPRPVEQPAAAPANVSYRNGSGHGDGAPIEEPHDPPRAQEPPRGGGRIAPSARDVARGRPEPERTVHQPRPMRTWETSAAAATSIARPSESTRTSQPPRQYASVARDTVAREPVASPPTSPAPVQQPTTRLSPISSFSTTRPASASPQTSRRIPPTSPGQPASTPSRFAEPATEPQQPRQEQPRQERASPSVSATSATASSAATSVPAALRSDDRLAALAKLVQGLRRNELSPIGEARLFLKLMTEQMATIGDITVATGRTKEQVARSLRLLGLSDRLRDLIDRGALSREQAFALLDTDDPDTANPVIPPSSGFRAP